MTRKILSMSLVLSVAAAAALAWFVGSGCTKPAPPPAPPAPSTDKPQTLRLLVVDDPGLAKEILRVRGEWQAQASAPLEVAELSTAELAAAKTLPADAILYPAAELGSLVERSLIRPLPAEWLNRPAFDKHDLFELTGQRETAWGGQIYAVPLGSPMMVLMIRSDWFAQFGKQPPTTWEEYQQCAKFFGRRENLVKHSPELTLPKTWAGTLEPLGPGSAGCVLLARAAAYARHPDYYSTLFDRQSMEPRVAGPPFVRALTELVAAAQASGDSGASSQKLTWADARAEFLAGHAAMALGWPAANSGRARSTATPAAATPATPPAIAPAEAQSLAIQFVELPGSPEMFNPRDSQWHRRDEATDPHVPLLGIAGRLGSVVESASGKATSSNASSVAPAPSPASAKAFELLVWLSTRPWDRQISPASAATTVYRRSQINEASHWVGPAIDAAAARQYANVEAQSCNRLQWLDTPRLPGRVEYLAALDEAVRRAVAGETKPQDALNAAADKWREITKRLGLESQRDAYQRSLGMER